MRSPIHARSAAIAATLSLSVFLVVSIVTGAGVVALNTTSAFAAGTCSVSSASSSSTSYAITSAGASSAESDALNSVVGVIGSATSASSAYSSISSALSSLQAVYEANCASDADIEDALAGASTDLSSAKPWVDSAQTYQTDAVNEYNTGVNVYMPADDWNNAINQFKWAMRDSNTANEYSAAAQCELNSANANLSYAQELISMCAPRSSSSSNSSLGNSSSTSSM